MSARRIWIALGIAALATGIGLSLAKAFHVPSRVGAWLVAEFVPKEPVDWPAARRVVLGAHDRLPEGSRGARSRLADAIASANEDAAIAVHSVDLDGERRDAVVAPVPSEFRQAFYVPADGQLSLSVGQLGAPLASGGVRFQLSLRPASAPPEEPPAPLFDVVVAPHARAWQVLRVDLSRWSGRRVELSFRASPADDSAGRNAAGDGALRAFWGDLFVYAPALPGSAGPPAILLLLIDTLRPDHLGAYGYGPPTSPNIDALARAGVRFENAITAAPWTDPSVLALHTGLYPSDMWKSEPHRDTLTKVVPSNVATLAERFAEAGYFTIAASDHPAITAKRFGRGFDVYSALYYREGAKYRWQQSPPASVAARVASLLDGRADQPVFLYLHVIYPHRPVRSGPGYRALFGVDTRDVDLSMRAELDEYVRRYDAEIRAADDVVGSVLRSFGAGRAQEDAVVVLLSDHGEGFYEHGLYEHGNSLYDELTRIPLIVRAPGRIGPGIVERAVVRTVDVYPTLIALAGLEPEEGIRGRSLLPLLAGAERDGRLAYSESPHQLEIVDARSMRSAERKLVLGAPPGVEAWFDLTQDPGEMAAQVGPDEDVEALQRALDALERDQRLHEAAPVRIVPEEETVESLRALGYVD